MTCLAHDVQRLHGSANLVQQLILLLHLPLYLPPVVLCTQVWACWLTSYRRVSEKGWMAGWANWISGGWQWLQ